MLFANANDQGKDHTKLKRKVLIKGPRNRNRRQASILDSAVTAARKSSLLRGGNGSGINLSGLLDNGSNNGDAKRGNDLGVLNTIPGVQLYQKRSTTSNNSSNRPKKQTRNQRASTMFKPSAPVAKASGNGMSISNVLGDRMNTNARVLPTVSSPTPGYFILLVTFLT